MLITNVKSSLIYQMLLHVNKPYSVFLFISLVLLFFYKGTILPYQPHIRVMEFLIILAFAPIEAVRISWGARGNLTETPTFLSFSLFLSIAMVFICVYLAFLQNFVLLIEEILVCIQGTIVIIESVIALALCGTIGG
ncbi:unnamed protein product [Auanema sp. JU1783]|nr:unnamed protein product [Auanema sp. JU1783]